MLTLTNYAGGFATPWLTLVAHAAWQGAIVGAVVLVLVTIGKRWPAPVRYAVLLLALLKFAMPPLFSAPTGLFSLVAVSGVSPTSLVDDGQVEDQTGSSPESTKALADASFAADEARSPFSVDETARVVPSDSSSLRRLVNDPSVSANPTRTRSEEQITDEAPAIATAGDMSPVAGTVAARVAARTGSKGTSRSLNWAAIALAVHFAGACAVLLAFAVSAWRLRVAVRRMEPAPAAIAQQAREVARSLGLRRIPAIKLSPTEQVPYSAGVLQPVVVLPAWHIGRLAPRELHAVLCHELAHHRRGDLWINLLQLAISAVWWFHPVVWLLNRAIRAVREECCDDLLLSRRFLDDEVYCTTLVRVAELCRHRSRPLVAAAISMADSPHPLAARVRRIMDDSLPRRERMGYVAMGVLLVAALVILPGVRAANTIERLNLPPAITPLAHVDEGGEQPEPAPVDGPRTMRVRVVDPAGNPIAAAPVVVSLADRQFQLEADAEGVVAFNYPEPPPGNIAVRIDLEPYLPLVARWKPVSETLPSEYVARLIRATTVGGRIVDEQRQPVAGATIRLWLMLKATGEAPGKQKSVDARSAADGTWSVGGLEPINRLTLQFSHAEFVSDRNGSTVSPQVLDLLQKRQHERVLQSGVTISGQVSDSLRQAVAGATVAVIGGMSAMIEAKAETDEAGGFRMQHCLPGKTALVVYKAGLAPRLQAIEIGRDVAGNEFAIELRPGQAVRARVTDTEGRPIKGAAITPAQGADQLTRALWQIHKFATTDAEGYWSWDSAPAEPWKYDVSHKGHMRLGRVALAPGDKPHPLTLIPELQITGTVVDDKTSEPIDSFAAIPGNLWPNQARPEYWRRDRVVKGRAGRFSIREDFPQEAHAVRIEAEGFRAAVSRAIRSDEGEVALEFRLEKSANLSGSVMAPDGTLVADAQVALATAADPLSIFETSPNSRSGFVTKTDAVGRFQFAEQSADFTVQVFANSGYARATRDDFETSGNEPRRLTLAPWARIEGIVRSRTGAAANERIRLSFDSKDPKRWSFDPYTQFQYYAVTDAQGRFRFERVPPDGEWLVIQSLVLDNSFGRIESTARSVQIAAKPGQTSSVALEVTGRDVVGRVRFADPPPEFDWESEFGEIRPMHVPPQAAATNRMHAFLIRKDGTFRIEGVLPGRYTIFVHAHRPGSFLESRKYRPIAQAWHEFTMPAAETGDEAAAAAEPLDVGELPILTDAARKAAAESRRAAQDTANKAEDK